jgi:hypothetical protein
MEITFKSKLGEGGFGDVWEATDALGRSVAVKIIRSPAAIVSNALDHARALARLGHPNVVSVYSIERVADPDGGQLVDAVVMELLRGETLMARVKGHRFSQQEAMDIGLGLLNGLGHIHNGGLAHGDLHADNVMLIGTVPKIIDILYTDSLALLSNASKESRLRKDILNLRMMLNDVLFTSELDPAVATEFNASLTHQPTLIDLRYAFELAVDQSRKGDSELKIERSLQRIRDEAFLEGDLYAKALASETPSEITLPLLERLLVDGNVTGKHRPYLRLLWDRLTATEKRDLSANLGNTLNAQIPNGRWPGPLQMLASFGKEGWDYLPQVARLRLEGAIVNDILAGQHDIYGPNIGQAGALGTYARTFWPRFHDVDRLVENIVARLNSGWYGQNYVGLYLLRIVPSIGNTATRREKLVQAIAYAVRNDSKVVVRELTSMPPDWQEEISAASTPYRNATEPSSDDDIPF